MNTRLDQACKAADDLASELEKRAARIREFATQVRIEVTEEEVPALVWINLHNIVSTEMSRMPSTTFFTSQCLEGAAGR